MDIQVQNKNDKNKSSTYKAHTYLSNLYKKKNYQCAYATVKTSGYSNILPRSSPKHAVISHTS